jgi:hypothetical protein
MANSAGDSRGTLSVVIAKWPIVRPHKSKGAEVQRPEKSAFFEQKEPKGDRTYSM